jgi:hypothetical protein
MNLVMVYRISFCFFWPLGYDPKFGRYIIEEPAAL